MFRGGVREVVSCWGGVWVLCNPPLGSGAGKESGGQVNFSFVFISATSMRARAMLCCVVRCLVQFFLPLISFPVPNPVAACTDADSLVLFFTALHPPRTPAFEETGAPV
jgi:hypothetical protein